MGWLTCISETLSSGTWETKKPALLVPSHLLKPLLRSVGALRSNKHRIKKTFKELVGGRAVGRIGKGSVFALFPQSSLLALSRLARREDKHSLVNKSRKNPAECLFWFTIVWLENILFACIPHPPPPPPQPTLKLMDNFECKWMARVYFFTSFSG